MSRRRLVVAGLVVLGIAYAIPVQEIGCNESAHYALVQQLARGTPRIDAIHGETCDLSYIDGHYYTAKAPGLALATLPAYVVLHSAGAVPANPAATARWPLAMSLIPRRAIWQVHLWSVLLPALALVLAVGLVAERLQQGSGIVLGAALGLGTLVLPFATDFFSHVLSAALGFGAFAVVFLGRRQRRLFLAGLLAGLGVVVEFPLAFVVALLGIYVVRAAPRARAAALYAGGAAVGASALALFNVWAFGSLTDLSYKNAVVDAGASGHDVVGANSSGFFGIGVPHPHVVFELLFTSKGLLVLSPVLALAPVGIGLLVRAGQRAEAALCAAILAVFVIWNSGYYLPFGGIVPGPRFLIPAIPFGVVVLAPLVRARPGPVVALALAGVAVMTGITATEPLLASDDTTVWRHLFADGRFTETAWTLIWGSRGWTAVTPFLAAVAAVVTLSAVAARLPLRRRDLVDAVAALFAWWLVLRTAPALLHVDSAGGWWGALAVLVVLAACAALLARPSGAGLVAAAPLTAILVPALAGRPKIDAALALAALVAVAAVDIVRHRGLSFMRTA
jgi:hypothetical protein